MTKTKQDISQLLAEESDAIEADRDAPIPAGTRVTRGHARTRTLQVRLNDDEYEALSRAAKAQHLPESTFARSALLEALNAKRTRVLMGQAIVRDTDLDQARELVGELGSILGLELQRD